MTLSWLKVIIISRRTSITCIVAINKPIIKSKPFIIVSRDIVVIAIKFGNF